MTLSLSQAIGFVVIAFGIGAIAGFMVNDWLEIRKQNREK